jgi:hypothetical protein
MDLFDNLVGYLTSLAISRLWAAKLLFLAEFVQKLKFLNNSNNYRIPHPFPLGNIMTVGPGYHQRQQHSGSAGGHMAFAPVFFPGRQGFSPPLPEPAALWSCSRPR